jgi:hypothetical protein
MDYILVGLLYTPKTNQSILKLLIECPSPIECKLDDDDTTLHATSHEDFIYRELHEDCSVNYQIAIHYSSRTKTQLHDYNI